MADYKATIQYASKDFFLAKGPSNQVQTIDTDADRKSAPSPMELLLISVGACTAADVISILQKKRQDVTGYKVEVTGKRRETHPRAFVKFHVHHLVYGRGVSARAVAEAIKLSDEKYCSVAATVRPQAQITTDFEIIEAES